MPILLLVVGIILFILLVVIHELGHFIVARRNGVVAEEFGIFFPPRIYKRVMKGGWVFSLNALPLGGFVKLKGEHDSDTEPGSFGAASLWAKSKIMVAGVVMNLVTALILFTIIALVGMPKIVDNQFTVKNDTKLVKQSVIISYVEPGSPADKGGLKSQDVLNDIALPDHSPLPVDNAKTLPKITHQLAGKDVIVYYERSGQHKEAKLQLLSNEEVTASKKTGNPKGYLGIVPTDFQLQRSTWSAPIVAIGLSTQLTALTFQGLGHALAGLGGLFAGAATGNTEARQNGQAAASENVSGPVGIFAILKSGSLLGYQFMLFIIAYISLTLAIMNILPIPALDGGRLWITLGSRAARRPLTAKQEEMINVIGFLVLISLIIVITFVDVKRFF